MSEPSITTVDTIEMAVESDTISISFLYRSDSYWSDTPSRKHFEIQRTTSLGTIIFEWCFQYGIPSSELDFMLNNQRVLPGDTPQQLGMRNQAEIYVQHKEKLSSLDDIEI